MRCLYGLEMHLDPIFDEGVEFYFVYPVRNNAPLLPPGQRPSGPSAAAGLNFRTIPAGFNAPLEFLTGFTKLRIYL
jgi:hypothetical protein